MTNESKKYMNEILGHLNQLFPKRLNGHKSKFSARMDKHAMVITMHIGGLQFEIDTNSGIEDLHDSPEPRWVAETIFVMFDTAAHGEKRFYPKPKQ